MDKEKIMALLDSPEVCGHVFHPRKQGDGPVPTGAQDHIIKADDGTDLGARFYLAGPESPHILYFHGNGEIAADYDDLAPLYVGWGFSFLAVDFRGYGKSGGSPTISSMLSDARAIFRQVKHWMDQEGRAGDLWVIGRSLGSATALEVADAFGKDFSGLIIESGFAQTESLLEILGINTQDMGEIPDGISNLAKIAGYKGPTLVIHAEYDHILALPHGEALFKEAGGEDKEFYLVKGANHNDIYARDLNGYMNTVSTFIRDHVSVEAGEEPQEEG